MAVNAPSGEARARDPYDVPDLTQLEHLDEKSLLTALQTRYNSGKIHVSTCVRCSPCFVILITNIELILLVFI